jgi:hypothetical protein
MVLSSTVQQKKVRSYRMSPNEHLTETQAFEGKTSLDTLTPVTSPVDDDEDERRRAGRGAGGNTASPTHAQLGANIRPDVVDAPGGLQVITTQKSADYRPDRAAQDYVRGELAEANRLAAPDEAQQLDILNRSNEESTRRQSAELAARKGEESPVISPSDYVASELRAAEKEAKQHHEAEAEIVISRDHPGDHPTVGGRGMF